MKKDVMKSYKKEMEEMAVANNMATFLCDIISLTKATISGENVVRGERAPQGLIKDAYPLGCVNLFKAICSYLDFPVATILPFEVCSLCWTWDNPQCQQNILFMDPESKASSLEDLLKEFCRGKSLKWCDRCNEEASHNIRKIFTVCEPYLVFILEKRLGESTAPENITYPKFLKMEPHYPDMKMMVTYNLKGVVTFHGEAFIKGEDGLPQCIDKSPNKEHKNVNNDTLYKNQFPLVLVYERGNKQRRTITRFDPGEVKAILESVVQYGPSWKRIKEEQKLDRRTPQDIKDKYTNLMKSPNLEKEMQTCGLNESLQAVIRALRQKFENEKGKVKPGNRDEKGKRKR